MALARVLGAKGLAGAVRIEVLTDHPQRLAVGEDVWIGPDDATYRIVEAAWGGRLPVVRLSGIEDRSAAEQLAGRFLEGPPSPLAEGSFYWHQLIGLRARDLEGKDLGSVVEVFRAGENEVYRIEGPQGELLVPALRDTVRSIDLGAGLMVVAYDAEEV